MRCVVAFVDHSASASSRPASARRVPPGVSRLRIPPQKATKMPPAAFSVNILGAVFFLGMYQITRSERGAAPRPKRFKISSAPHEIRALALDWQFARL